MSLPIPLSIRLRTARGERNVTREVRDLTMRWTDPGGYQSAQIALNRPLTLQPDEIAYYGDLTIHDGRNGQVVWDGRLEDPGRSAGGQGQVWDIAAVGGQSHTRDRIVPLIYVDQPLSQLERVDNVVPAGTTAVGTDPGIAGSQVQALVLQFPQGLTIATSARIVMRYVGLQRSGQKLARIDHTWDAGRTDTAFQVQAVTRTDGLLSGGENARSDTWNTAGGGSSPRLIVTNFPSGRTTVEWRVFYSGVGGTVSDGNHWASISNMIVQATRYNAAGTEQLTAASYPNNYVLAHEIVADLLGRLLTEFDGAGARIDSTTHQIDQLIYPDGVDAARVLDDLMTLEGGFTWRAWERGSNGLFRFEWVPTPSTVRYVADVTDGYDSQGSADGLYNRVTVRWRDTLGQPLTATVSATVPLLDDAGLIRQGRIDLGSDAGSATAAIRAGQQWLAARRYPPNAGRLRIARPILDLQTGRMVMPWEIGPGLIRVRGILPRPDALNATARDGVTIFRVIGGEYRASDGAATLDLDSYAPSVPRQIADIRRATSGIRR
ncbi:hypothetical protein [Micromonospora deserti]|uniref:Tip attachment protein J domain-containing protein n=1 Tax=Micromonospora deserti TaxID=2070366 RepID=A0A2W2DMB1_9ACTN|nr:hypothetical protein [Micromonospora deserti]PZF98266.1 hypothetical protein C1I99_13855 [Micromonospora deserti]